MPRATQRPGGDEAEAEPRWWSRRWLAALERTGWASRLERGQAYARAGRVRDLKVESGRVTARVQGSTKRPYQVEVQVLPLASPVWRAVAARVAERPRAAAELLASRLPPSVEDVFAAAGARLFPEELMAECTCPDWAAPCKHVAAVCYTFGERVDEDPFLLFRLRGRSREQFLADLERAGEGPAATPRPSGAGARGARPETVAAEDFWAPRSADVPDAGAAGAALGLPEALAEPGWWRGRRPLRDLLAEVYAGVREACAATLPPGSSDPGRGSTG